MTIYTPPGLPTPDTYILAGDGVWCAGYYERPHVGGVAHPPFVLFLHHPGFSFAYPIAASRVVELAAQGRASKDPANDRCAVTVDASDAVDGAAWRASRLSPGPFARGRGADLSLSTVPPVRRAA